MADPHGQASQPIDPLTDDPDLAALARRQPDLDEEAAHIVATWDGEGGAPGRPFWDGDHF